MIWIAMIVIAVSALAGGHREWIWIALIVISVPVFAASVWAHRTGRLPCSNRYCSVCDPMMRKPNRRDEG